MGNVAIQKLIRVALAAIKAAYKTKGHENGVTLFISHHLAEIDPSYWEELLQTASPKPAQIIDALILCSELEYEEDEEMDSFDFTLPGDVTDYVLCVAFDDDGEVEAISMES